MRTSLLIRLHAFFAIAALTVAASAQAPGSSESLLIASGDLLHVSVLTVPELDQHVRVLDSGDVMLALVGAVRVADKTPYAAGQAIAAALQQGGYLRRPDVSIFVEQYAVASVSVAGQVVHPGNYPLATPRDLKDVLSLAGGLNDAADIHVTIQRHSHGEAVHVALPNDPDAAILNSVLVFPGDTVLVPKAGIVYVLGDVTHPGGYVMDDDAQITALQAIARAAGLTRTAAADHARLVRQTPSGPVDLPLALHAMQTGKAPDIELHPQDVLYVPFSTARNILLGASAILSSTGGAAIYATH